MDPEAALIRSWLPQTQLDITGEITVSSNSEFIVIKWKDVVLRTIPILRDKLGPARHRDFVEEFNKILRDKYPELLL